jgi:hypothetical protein
MNEFAREIAIQIIQMVGFASGGLMFGIGIGFGMWATGVKMTIATVEKKEPTP